MGVIKRLIPKHALTDKVAFTFTHVGLTGIILFEMLHVLPMYHEKYSTLYKIHVSAALFIAYQVFSNMYCLILVDSSVKAPDLKLPFILQSGWTYCHVCQVNAPPRSHHCPICEVCVLKRDHHCIFTGNCVGFYNHRYFVAMVTYLWLGCVYTLIFTREFYAEILGDFDYTLVFKFLFPMLVWVFGYISVYQLSVLIVMVINIMAMFLFSCLIGFQVFFISRGQTQFECKKKLRNYHHGFFINWQTVLGKYWYLIWFSCFIPSPLPGDGVEFQRMGADMSLIHEEHLKI